ncbi:MAG: hypothetical protein ACREJO_05155 [Phycisphaerales bacterium]
MLQVLAQSGQGGGGGGTFGLGRGTLQILLFALVLSWSGLMWLIRYLREQKKIRDARDRETQRRTEALRTGRDAETFAAPTLTPRMAPSSQQTGAAEAQRELQERRQQQLRELRKKAAGQQPTPIPARQVARAAPPTARPGPATVELWPGGPKVVVGQAGPPQPPRQQPVQQQQQQQRPQKKSRQRVPQVQTVSSSVTNAPGSIHARAEISAIRSLDDRSEIPTTAVTSADMPRTAQQWRTAFIASEVLGTPVGLR